MKPFIKNLCLILITAIFTYLVFVNIDFKQLITTVRNIDYSYLLLLPISIIISLSFRGLCFKLLISKSINIPLKLSAPLCITGTALNIFLPARAGDIFRAIYIGNKFKSDKIKLLGTVMLERVFDGIVILALLFIGIFVYNKNPIAQKLSILGVLIFFGTFLLAFLAIKFNKVNSICLFLEEKSYFLPDKLKNIFHSFLQFTNRTCNSFIEGFEVLNYPKTLFLSVLSFFCIWIFECLNFYIVILGFHCAVNWSITLFIISFIALACMIPSTSIFIGPYQYAVITAFNIYHLPKETALAVSLVEQSIVMITTAVIAFIFLFKNNISCKDLKKESL